ncbi:S-adenosyl-L-methionine-dependent methyltransferase [Periconia macrospinosa]|uniref:S-adenosyl-L-methionine-dependent methyltransferase n=1 Tax=Periconia macrospinosa TaxID=97972 RepID=A0A2V1DQ71_9PLEO|nr:S-adenosyl-L-methionine-dependent methyltransferase [Periconia macrospinosa]
MASGSTVGGGAQPQTGAQNTEGEVSTQNTQYDQIGMRYNSMHDLPVVQPEKPSVVAALGDIRGKTCLDLACGTGRYTALLATLGASVVQGYDISATMVEGARTTYPQSTHPNLSFAIADCSQPDTFPEPKNNFDIVFAGWFLNYAGTRRELTNMFRAIASQLKPPTGKFIGITTNGSDTRMKEEKRDFYGLDVLVLEREYKDPETGEELGIKARIIAQTEPVVQFDVFQFRRDVYEQCAADAGLVVAWKEVVVPQDERREGTYWDRFLERPSFVIVEARSK